MTNRPAGDPARRGTRLTVRLRLTFSYAGFLVVAGAALIAVAFLWPRSPRAGR